MQVLLVLETLGNGKAVAAQPFLAHMNEQSIIRMNVRRLLHRIDPANEGNLLLMRFAISNSTNNHEAHTEAHK